MPLHRACRVVILPFVVALSLRVAPVRADESARADALFREGRKAMEAHDWTRAVTVFTESQRLSPAPGTLLNLAIAEERLGRVAAAWEHARGAREGLAPSDERETIARDLHVALERRLPTLVLSVTPGFSSNATVTLDGAEVRPATFGIALPIDPGAHEIVVRSADHAERTVVVRLDEGMRLVEALHEGPLLEAPSSRRESDRKHTSAPRPWRTVGWASLASSGAFAVTGTVLGALAIDRNSIVVEHCRGKFCPPIGANAASEGRTFATVSTIGFVAAGVFAAVGIAALLFGDRP